MISIVASIFAFSGLTMSTADYVVVALGVIIAALMSFFGTVGGTRAKDAFERSKK